MPVCLCLKELWPKRRGKRKLKDHIGENIGNKGVAAAKVAKIYASKVPSSVTNSVEKFKKAKVIFDNDTEANKKKYLEKALQEIRDTPRKPRKKKRTTPNSYSETSYY